MNDLCRHLALAVLVLSVTTAASPAPTPGPALSMRVTGAPEVVLRWASGACDKTMIPDAPARAYRDSGGQVRLLATSFKNWSLYGPSLDTVKPECQSLFRGAESADPQAFDDRGWIEAVFATEGRKVYALLSNEWDGFRHDPTSMGLPPVCSVKQYTPACMAYSINGAVSEDDGHNFLYVQDREQHVIAGVPYHANSPGRDGHNINEAPAPAGTPTVSNIVYHEGHFYVMVYARGSRRDEDGNCLMRTETLDDAKSWRGWDGHGFTVRPVESGPSPSAPRTCQRVARDILGWDVRSVSWQASSRSFVAIMQGAAMDAAGRRIVGVYYSTSPNLLQWSGIRLLFEAPSQLDSKCLPPIHYPSMLDPTSSSRNFDTVGATAYIYYTQYNLHDCHVSLDRDLLRVPVSME